MNEGINAALDSIVRDALIGSLGVMPMSISQIISALGVDPVRVAVVCQAMQDEGLIVRVNGKLQLVEEK